MSRVKRFGDWLAKLGVRSGCHEPPVRNPGPPDFEIQAAPEGCPIPYIEEYEDGSAKLIRGDESEWAKRPDEEGGEMSKNGLIKMSFNAYDRYRAAEDKLRSLGYEYTGDEYWRPTIGPEGEDGKTLEDCKARFNQAFYEGVEKGRSTNSPKINMFPDLEYSAIGDKSEPKKFVAGDEPMYFSAKDGKSWIGVDPGTDERPTQLDRIEAGLCACLKVQNELAVAVSNCAESTVKMMSALSSIRG